MRRLYGVELLPAQRPKPLAALPPVDVVVTMGCGVQCPSLPCRLREDWGLADPTGRGDAAFEQTARAIEARVRDLRRRLAPDDGTRA